MRATLGRFLQQRAEPLSPQVQRIVVIVCAVGLVAASIWAWNATDLRFGDINWTPVVWAFVLGGTGSLAMKAISFIVAARIVGQSPSIGRSIEVGVVSSAANLLPLPGSLLVTIRSLSEDGSRYGEAMAAGALPGLAWVAFTGVVGGGAIMVEGSDAIGALVIVGGIAAGVVAAVLFRSVAPPTGRPRLAVELIGAQAGWLLVSALRLGLAMEALDIDASWTQAAALSVAGAMTGAIGFVPGGLGVREAIIAGLAPIVGLPLDVGVLIGTLDRVIWLAYLALAAAVLGVVRARRNNPTPESAV